MILTFVVDATEDVLGVTRLHHVALTGFLGGFLGCDIDFRCGCYRRCSWRHAFASCGTNRVFWGGLGCDIDVRCGCYRRCSWCHAFASCGTNRVLGGVLGYDIDVRTKKVKCKKTAKSVLSGTQCVDRWWQSLEKAVPSSLHAKQKSGGAISERLMQYIWAYVWRSNLDVQVNMPRALGEIC